MSVFWRFGMHPGDKRLLLWLEGGDGGDPALAWRDRLAAVGVESIVEWRESRDVLAEPSEVAARQRYRDALRALSAARLGVEFAVLERGCDAPELGPEVYRNDRFVVRRWADGEAEPSVASLANLPPLTETVRTDSPVPTPAQAANQKTKVANQATAQDD